MEDNFKLHFYHDGQFPQVIDSMCVLLTTVPSVNFVFSPSCSSLRYPSPARQRRRPSARFQQ